MSSTSNTAVKKDLTKLQRAIIDGLEDVKAQDIQVFDTEHLSPLFERVIVATGTSNRQTKAIASSVRDAVKKAGFATPRHEGEASGEWIIVDCNQAVVHIMQPAIRQYYRLEELWGDTPVRVKLGGAKPKPKAAKPKAEADDAVPAKKKPAARKTADAAEEKAAPAKKALKKTVVKKITGTVAAKPAAKKAATKTVKPAAKKPAAPVKKVVVNKPKPAAKKAAAKPAAKSAAKPAAKSAARPAAKRAPAKTK